MAGNIICQMFFRASYADRPEVGVSESLVNMTADTLPLALRDLQALALVRAQLLGWGARISDLRVSKFDSTTVRNIDFFRDSQRSDGPTPTNGSVVGILPYYNPAFAQSPIDQPKVAMMMRGEGGTLFKSRRPIYIHFVPDEVTNAHEWPVGPGAFRTALQAYKLALLTGAKWGFRCIDQTADGNPQRPITGVTRAANPVITCPAHGFAVGQVVRIYNVQGDEPFAGGIAPRTISGYFQIASSVDANTFTVYGLDCSTFTYRAGGAARAKKYTAVAFNSIEARRWTEVGGGRPFAAVPGKRKKKK